MALTGTFNKTLDGKRRLAIPKRIKEELVNKQFTQVYIAPGTETSLLLFSEKGFEQQAQRLKEYSNNVPEAARYLRLYYSRAEKVEVDAQGRICIPERLANLASLEAKQEVILIGVQDHAEIWSTERWETYLKDHGPHFDEMASQAFGQMPW
ncbi:division/cell wall cluster transcriptional repressor MraZ [Gimesia aquarii]|uniref:Transcriptional regulator MraZ n=1 Tax=Gimesia aquarii TaxID=2527964 RepID=A0A517WW93_9PLAN|nr:division/cell wall cluster transcriptional repressor MraZ [Gimesia aquarii]QDU09536.1 Transcriptional regulator MraZ [Gimesia aquarii]